ncbi:hypothetical protein G9A89_005006 [Geosiphon pyriformis]|nr:hypothetical protein G9A89_005006 [Geosiphon pyriformis]
MLLMRPNPLWMDHETPEIIGLTLNPDNEYILELTPPVKGETSPIAYVSERLPGPKYINLNDGGPPIRINEVYTHRIHISDLAEERYREKFQPLIESLIKGGYTMWATKPIGFMANGDIWYIPVLDYQGIPVVFKKKCRTCIHRERHGERTFSFITNTTSSMSTSTTSSDTFDENRPRGFKKLKRMISRFGLRRFFKT